MFLVQFLFRRVEWILWLHRSVAFYLRYHHVYESTPSLVHFLWVWYRLGGNISTSNWLAHHYAEKRQKFIVSYCQCFFPVIEGDKFILSNIKTNFWKIQSNLKLTRLILICFFLTLHFYTFITGHSESCPEAATGSVL